MAEASRTVRGLLHPAQECMHLARIDCLEGFGKKSFENQDISTSPPYGPLIIEGKEYMLDKNFGVYFLKIIIAEIPD